MVKKKTDVESIDAELQKLGAEKDKIREQMRELTRQRDAIVSSGPSGGQTVSLKGIESSEEFGKVN